MKKMIALALATAMCTAAFAGCSNETASSSAASSSSEPASSAPVVEEKPEEDLLADAVAYVKTIYKNAAEITSKDYQVIATVPVGTEKFDITWSADVAEDTVKIVKGDDGMVTIDVNEGSTEEVPYVLTATLSDASGKTESLSWNHILPATMNVDGMTYAELVDLAYTVEDGVTLEDSYRLFGTITNIDTAWSEDYKNITVTIAVDGREDKPVMCYRLAGEGAKDLKVGDEITVEGQFTNYKGTIEFNAGCQLVGMGEHVDQSALLKAAFALGEGASMDYPSVMTGVVTEIPTAWSDEYGNITVNFQVEDQVIMAYRLSGEGAKDLAVGDTVTVAGTIKNYKGTIEYDQGCKLLSNDAYHSAKNALSGYKLLDGEAQESAKTITGVITNVDTAWSPDYKNITVTIQVGGLEDYKIMCYRLAGEGAETLAVGNTITVTGTLKNYKGTIEFDAGCSLDAIGETVAVEAPVEEAPAEEAPAVEAPADPAEIVAAAYALGDGESLPYTATLTGAITAVDTAWSAEYKNITVTIAPVGSEDKPIMCYRLKGDGAEGLAVGNNITVTGTLKNYKGTIEFDAGCTLDSIN